MNPRHRWTMSTTEAWTSANECVSKFICTPEAYSQARCERKKAPRTPSTKQKCNNRMVLLSPSASAAFGKRAARVNYRVDQATRKSSPPGGQSLRKDDSSQGSGLASTHGPGSQPGSKQPGSSQEPVSKRGASLPAAAQLASRRLRKI